MKVVILAGGFGTRLQEETHKIPKPMVRIGSLPILEHIMNYFYNYGYSDFIILTGYKNDVINDYFFKECKRKLKLQIDNQSIKLDYGFEWNVNLVNTGLDSTTAKRLYSIKDQIQDTFFLTYGDGLTDIDISRLLKFHHKNGLIATISAVHPPARFGLLEIEGSKVIKFTEKGLVKSDFINGGYFVLEKDIFEYLENLEKSFEETALPSLAKNDNLAAFKHLGFWQPMDTLREKKELDYLYRNNMAPWVNKQLENEKEK
jgi:glucose-1-phosphate cytidylyltransferase